MPFNTQQALREEIRRSEIRKRTKRLKKLSTKMAPQQDDASQSKRSVSAQRQNRPTALSAYSPVCADLQKEVLAKRRTRKANRPCKACHASKTAIATGLSGMDIKQ